MTQDITFNFTWRMFTHKYMRFYARASTYMQMICINIEICIIFMIKNCLKNINIICFHLRSYKINFKIIYKIDYNQILTKSIQFYSLVIKQVYNDCDVCLSPLLLVYSFLWWVGDACKCPSLDWKQKTKMFQFFPLQTFSHFIIIYDWNIFCLDFTLKSIVSLNEYMHVCLSSKSWSIVSYGYGLEDAYVHMSIIWLFTAIKSFCEKFRFIPLVTII